VVDVKMTIFCIHNHYRRVLHYRSPLLGFIYTVLLVFLLNGCGSGSGGNDLGGGATSGEIEIRGTPGDEGIFDPAPVWDDVSTLWMSYSSVSWSLNDSTLIQVHSRIASSSDGGVSWTDEDVDPNKSHVWPDFTGEFNGDTYWATWRFEVSRLVYDPYDSNPNRRWKILWHRYLTAGAPVSAKIFENGWIGYSSASAPDASWSDERKLFTGSLYNDTDMDAFIGAPEFPLDVSNNSDLGGCTLFTEPGVLARSDGIYISLQCTGEKKIVLLRCNREFSSCDYLGDLLSASDAQQFSQSGQSLSLFGAPELVDTTTATYLIVTGIEDISATENRYTGCVVFRISDLANAKVEREMGVPVLVDRVEGTDGSFNGACGYDYQAVGSGIIYSEFIQNDSPRFRMFHSYVTLP
jgi:hypothetical protein